MIIVIMRIIRMHNIRRHEKNKHDSHHANDENKVENDVTSSKNEIWKILGIMSVEKNFLSMYYELK